MILTKIDINGNITWSRKYASNNSCYGVNVFGQNDGGYLLFGNSPNGSPAGAYLIKTDSLGNNGCADSLITQTTNNITFSITIPNDTISSVVTEAQPQPNVTIQNPASFALCYEGINEYRNINNITISPNPFTSLTTIYFSQEQTNTTIKITDILGKEIKALNFSGKELIIMKGTMQAGIYFVQITDVNKNIVNRKVVVE